MQNLMEISFDYYKVFYEVARSHSITLAASHLCLTQPTVTKYIMDMKYTKYVKICYNGFRFKKIKMER